MRLHPRWLFLLLLALAAGYIIATADRLPQQVASHFGANNLPDAAMTRDFYRAYMLGFTVVFPLAIVGAIGWLPRLFPRHVNLPNRDYWLAPEQREQTLADLRALACWLGCMIVLFMAGIHFVILVANASVPPALPANLFIGIGLSFVALLALWIVILNRHFRRPA